MIISNLSGIPYFGAFVLAMIFLYAIAFFLGIHLKSYLTKARVEKFLVRKSGIWGNVVAAMFGAITPFCSCTTVPIFSGMLASDIRLGCAMSFLIASPTINPPALILLFTLFGWKITTTYIAAVFFAAVLGGKLLGQKKLTNYVRDILLFPGDIKKISWRDMTLGYCQFLRRFIFVIFLAAVVATLLKGMVLPENAISTLTNSKHAAIPASVGLGILIYADLMLLIPIAHTFISQGVSQGAVFAFTMAASGVGLPSLILLSRVVHKKLIFYYTAVLCGLLVFLGYMINYILD